MSSLTNPDLAGGDVDINVLTSQTLAITPLSDPQQSSVLRQIPQEQSIPREKA